MIFDYQKAIRAYKSLMDGLWNNLNTLNIKKEDEIQILKNGIERNRLDKLVKQKKVWKELEEELILKLKKFKMLNPKIPIKY